VPDVAPANHGQYTPFMDVFRWNDWNLEHIAEHAVGFHEAEEIVRHARAPYPEKVDQRKYRVRGQTTYGRYLQVIYIVSPPGHIYVIHARDLTDREIHQYRRRLR
jgi:uncharacterized DUF497 family protein